MLLFGVEIKIMFSAWAIPKPESWVRMIKFFFNSKIRSSFTKWLGLLEGTKVITIADKESFAKEQVKTIKTV